MHDTTHSEIISSVLYPLTRLWLWLTYYIDNQTPTG